MEQHFAAQSQGLPGAQRHGVVQLEGMVGDLFLVLGIAVCQVDNRRVGAEVVGHLGGGGTVVQLVGLHCSVNSKPNS